MSVSPPRTTPSPAFSKMLTVARLPWAAMPIFSNNQTPPCVIQRPRKVVRKLLGEKNDSSPFNGWYQGISPSGMIRLSSMVKPTILRSETNWWVYLKSGNPSPSSINRFVLTCSGFWLSYLSVKHQSYPTIVPPGLSTRITSAKHFA
jgi:hypothetical protein